MKALRRVKEKPMKARRQAIQNGKHEEWELGSRERE